MMRTHTCGELTKKHEGQKAALCGWVHRRRDHGGLIFIDLRDRYGLTQVKFDPESSFFLDPAHADKQAENAKEVHGRAEKLRAEWVVRVEGVVVPRPDDMVNKKLKTGTIEVEATGLEILSEAKEPPFAIDEEKAAAAGEALRLQYRFLDLRRPSLQEIMFKRDRIIEHVRDYFRKRDFIEIQTPVLANSSPEGARDYLVPSRLHPGKFYALPQAPQQFKQLLMVAGFDRYFQIAPCFRDEDTRADRHPGDFYQIDVEMSFVEQEDVWRTVEPLMVELTRKFSDKKVLPIQKMTWHEAMNRYGTDKPDLRFGFEIEDITDLVRDCGFKVFANAVKTGGAVHALKVKDGAKLSRKEIDGLTETAEKKGAKGLAYIIIKGRGEYQSPIVKHLGEDLIVKIIKSVKAEVGDILFFAADRWLTVCRTMGAVRDECGLRFGLKDRKLAAWCWVYDFPMYELNEESGKIDFSHNPFSMPQGGLSALETKDPLEILAFQYDIVCNGYEISSGAIRNHDPEIMYKAFGMAGYSKDEVNKRFGHMIKAFEYGAPPHGGIAPGLDRILMILLDCESIRDIYAFPKDGQARDLMLGSPGEVDEEQLKELGLQLRK